MILFDINQLFMHSLNGFKYSNPTLIILFNIKHLFTELIASTNPILKVLFNINHLLGYSLNCFKYCYQTLIILFNVNHLLAQFKWIQVFQSNIKISVHY